MAFHFQLAEPFEAGLRRLLGEQIALAQRELTAGSDRAVAVHESRKALKRCRSLLHLVRPVIGDETYRAENARLREVGQCLSGARDRHVMLETLAKLEAGASASQTSRFAEMRRVIAASGAPEVTPEAVGQAMELLSQSREGAAGLTLAVSGFAAVHAGLELTYRRGRKAFRAAYREPSDEAIHEWRKAVQQHWRQMAVLEACWPDAMKARAALAKRLSQLLGDDHDLAVLAAFAAGEMDARLERVVTMAAKAAQSRIRAEAAPLGELLYAEKPGVFADRIARYWASAERAAGATSPSPGPGRQVKGRNAAKPGARKPKPKSAAP